MNLPARQEAELAKVDERMARVYRRAFQKLGGMCRFDGARTEEESAANMRAGTSRVKNPRNSKHVIWKGRPKALAIDVYPTGPGVTTESLKKKETYDPIASAMKEAALEEGVAIKWGWDMWEWDAPHWELA